MASVTLPAPTQSPATAVGLTYADVGRLLQCSPKTVERRAAGIPGRFRVGRLVRFDRAAVLAWIAAGCPAAE